MPPPEARYTFAVEPIVYDRLLANEEESIYGHLGYCQSKDPRNAGFTNELHKGGYGIA
jgi:hypothetical protein